MNEANAKSLEQEAVLFFGPRGEDEERSISESLLANLGESYVGKTLPISVREMDRAVDLVVGPMLRDKLRAEAKVQILLGAFSKLREIACNFAPVVGHSKEFEPIRKLIAHRETMEKAIDDVIAKG